MGNTKEKSKSQKSRCGGVGPGWPEMVAKHEAKKKKKKEGDGKGSVTGSINAMLAAREKENPVDEELVARQHDALSHWMKWLFLCGDPQHDGSIKYPARTVEKWYKEMNTKYEDLSEQEKDHRRQLVRDFLVDSRWKERKKREKEMNEKYGPPKPPIHPLREVNFQAALQLLREFPDRFVLQWYGGCLHLPFNPSGYDPPNCFPLPSNPDAYAEATSKVRPSPDSYLGVWIRPAGDLTELMFAVCPPNRRELADYKKLVGIT